MEISIPLDPKVKALIDKVNAVLQNENWNNTRNNGMAILSKCALPVACKKIFIEHICKEPFKTMAQVREANKIIGNHWFDKDTMKHFKSKIETKLIKNKYFISSEDNFHHMREYKIRTVNYDGSIKVILDNPKYSDLEMAKIALRCKITEEERQKV